MRRKYTARMKQGHFGRSYGNKKPGRGCKLVRLGTMKVLDKRGAERTIIHCTYVNKGKSYGRK